MLEFSSYVKFSVHETTFTTSFHFERWACENGVGDPTVSVEDWEFR